MTQVDQATGEILEGEEVQTALIPLQEASRDIFMQISASPVPEDKAKILLAPVDVSELDILPTGEVYLPQVHYRARLNKAFGPGGWAIRPIGQPQIRDNQVVQDWALYANGQYMSWATGGAEYKEGNQRMTWSDVLETVKSNALMRLCKDLGIAAECWDRIFTSAFKKEFGVKVWVETRGSDKSRPQWRRLDADPFFNETGIVEDSPNKDKYASSPAKPSSRQRPTQSPATTQPQTPTSDGHGGPPPEPHTDINSPNALLVYAKPKGFTSLSQLLDVLEKLRVVEKGWPMAKDAQTWMQAVKAIDALPAVA